MTDNHTPLIECPCIIQGALSPPQLWKEVALFERLLYKNRNQHRHARYFKRCEEVRFLYK